VMQIPQRAEGVGGWCDRPVSQFAAGQRRRRQGGGKMEEEQIRSRPNTGQLSLPLAV